MRRTASHVLSSPNPAQLEMRILANHGADRRFAFLRGRWSRAWRLAKGHAKLQLEKDKEKEETRPAAALGGLGGYGDSDDEESASSPEANSKLPAFEPQQDVPSDATAAANEVNTVAVDEETLKEARRARAKEWAAQRRAQMASDQAGPT